jgi:Protein of unknown function (DUF1653)
MDEADFKLGIYEHYKGGRYTAVMVVQHHQTREPMVVYVSHERGSVNCRPLRGWKFGGDFSDGPAVDPDGFLDEVTLADDKVPRFSYVGPARS